VIDPITCVLIIELQLSAIFDGSQVLWRCHSGQSGQHFIGYASLTLEQSFILLTLQM